MIEIDPEITVGKDKVLVKTDVEIIIEGMGTCKILVEIMAETEAETLIAAIVVTGVGQEKEAYLPEGKIIIIIGKTQILGLDQGSRSRSNSRIRTNRDRNECPNAITSDSEGHESDNAALQVMATNMESGDTQDSDSYIEDTEYLNSWKVRMVPPHFYQKEKRVEK